MTAVAHSARKGPRDENFPVASWFIERRHRRPILAFYHFVRAADDVADHPQLSRAEKLARLDRLERALDRDDSVAEAGMLRSALQAHGMTDAHARDLLSAFRQDVVKQRYADWDELIDYCARSAMPVGRFVLDVHGESRITWGRSDALCAALQIINHLQDCALDFRNLDRVYLPGDVMAAHGATVDDLAAARAGRALRACLRDLAGRTEILLRQSDGLEDIVTDGRLAAEIAAIRALAQRLVGRLQRRDPLSETVHLGKVEALAIAAAAGAKVWLRRILRGPAERNQDRPI
ncbi:MAG: squalene synthase HpnC [Bradyrhizobiaceae bacterium]|nr:MAG: squalene synthase HpnC [Bradyrhizobiaceae bacterium]